MTRFPIKYRHRRLAPVLICFCIAIFGNLLGAVASALHVQGFYPVAFTISALGIVACLACILYAWWALLSGRWSAQAHDPSA